MRGGRRNGGKSPFAGEPTGGKHGANAVAQIASFLNVLNISPKAVLEVPVAGLINQELDLKVGAVVQAASKDKAYNAYVTRSAKGLETAYPPKIGVVKVPMAKTEDSESPILPISVATY